MSLLIAVPDDIQTALEGEWGDLGRHLQENLAADGFSKGVLSLAQVRRLLGLATRLQAQEFLGRRGIPVFDYDPSELDREAALLEKLTPRE